MDETSNTEANTETTIQTNIDSVSPSTGEAVVEPVAVPIEPTVTPASAGEPEVADLPVIQIAPESSQPEAGANGNTPSSEPAPETPAPQIIERVVEKEVIKEVIKEVPVDRVVEKIVEKPIEVIKEVIKEVPVEKVVEKIVEKVVEKVVHQPPTKEEFDALLHEYLDNLSKQGTAKKHELMLMKEAKILSLASTKASITHKEVVDLLDCSTTTATRLLHLLCEEGKLTLHDRNPSGHHGGNSTTYTKP